MKKSIMLLTNKLIELLDRCIDGEFVDEVCSRISSCDPFYDEGLESYGEM